MKIGGKEISGPHEELLVLPRGEDQVVFRARAVADMDPFEKICPEPKPPGRLTKDGFVPNKDDDNFKKMMEHHSEQRLAYMVIISLEPSEVEWAKVDIDNPKTWRHWQAELKEAGLTQIEVNRIIQTVMRANALDEDMLKEARATFVRGLEEQAKATSGHQEEPESTPSGEPVPASE
jgi:hypothetical protein